MLVNLFVHEHDMLVAAITPAARRHRLVAFFRWHGVLSGWARCPRDGGLGIGFSTRTACDAIAVTGAPPNADQTGWERGCGLWGHTPRCFRRLRSLLAKLLQPACESPGLLLQLDLWASDAGNMSSMTVRWSLGLHAFLVLDRRGRTVSLVACKAFSFNSHVWRSPKGVDSRSTCENRCCDRFQAHLLQLWPAGCS